MGKCGSVEPAERTGFLASRFDDSASASAPFVLLLLFHGRRQIFKLCFFLKWRQNHEHSSSFVFRNKIKFAKLFGACPAGRLWTLNLRLLADFPAPPLDDERRFLTYPMSIRASHLVTIDRSAQLSGSAFHLSANTSFQTTFFSSRRYFEVLLFSLPLFFLIYHNNIYQCRT